MGGAWERMIHTVRKILTALTRDQPLDDEAFSHFHDGSRGDIKLKASCTDNV